jgi:hypothetical protein
MFAQGGGGGCSPCLWTSWLTSGTRSTQEWKPFYFDRGVCCDPLTSPTPQAELMPAIPRVLEVAAGCRASSDVQSQALMFIAAVSFPEENKVQLHTLASCTCCTKGFQ